MKITVLPSYGGYIFKSLFYGDTFCLPTDLNRIYMKWDDDHYISYGETVKTDGKLHEIDPNYVIVPLEIVEIIAQEKS